MLALGPQHASLTHGLNSGTEQRDTKRKTIKEKENA